jgi:hypothetical protein
MNETRDDEWADLPAPQLARAAALGRVGLRALRRATPALYHFLAGKRPQLKVSWGRNELHLRRDGLVWIPRETVAAVIEVVPEVETDAAPPLPFVPRRAGEQNDDPHMFRTPSEGLDEVDTDGPLDLEAGALEAEVKRRMGMREDDEEVAQVLTPELKSAEALNAEIARIRDVLQALDDVDDHALINELDDELYQLYKAVDYKMRRHHASEAKVELGKLFKM